MPEDEGASSVEEKVAEFISSQQRAYRDSYQKSDPTARIVGQLHDKNAPTDEQGTSATTDEPPPVPSPPPSDEPSDPPSPWLMVGVGAGVVGLVVVVMVLMHHRRRTQAA